MLPTWPDIKLKAVRLSSVRSGRLVLRDSIWESPDLFRLLVGLGGLLWVTRPFGGLIDLSGWSQEVMLLLMDIDSRYPDKLKGHVYYGGS